MSNLFDHLDATVHKRYTRSLADINFEAQFTASTSQWGSPLPLGKQTWQEVTAWHKDDIDRRIIPGAEPSQAPFLIRYFLDEGIEFLRCIFSKWDITALNGSLQELFEIGPKYLDLAYLSSQLGFYCASKEIDPLQSYALEYKYDNKFYQHLLRTQRVAYASDLQHYAAGTLDHIDCANYRAACRDITFFCASNLIESLTKARADLSGCLFD